MLFRKKTYKVDLKVNRTNNSFIDKIMDIFSKNDTNYSGNLPAFTKCLQLIGNGIAAMPLKGYNDKTNVDLPILKTPNDIMTGFQFRKYMAMKCAHKGNSFAYILRDEKLEPKQLLPINGSCDIIFNKDTNMYLYQIKDQNQFFKSIPNLIDSSNILHFKANCINSPFFGEDVIGSHKNIFELSQKAISSLNNFYKSGTHKVLLKSQSDKVWTEENQKIVKESIDRVLNGQSNTVTVPSGVDIETISLTPNEAGYLTAIRATSHDIALMFNVPPSMVVLDNSATKSSVEQDFLLFQSQTLLPIAIDIEQELESKLFFNKKITYKHTFNSLLRANSSERINFYSTAINNGILSPNQALEFEDLPTYEGGDIRFANAANIPVDKFNSWIDAKIANLEVNTKNNNPNGKNE